VNSNGVAYADLDNDGDLDLVINNLDDEASIYENNAINNFISIKLIGNNKNINAIGSKIKVYTDSLQQSQELFLSRGYQSSVSPVLNFGIGNEELIKRIEVVWPNGKITVSKNVSANQTITFNQKKALSIEETKNKLPKNFTKINPAALGLNYKHTENKFNDFSRQVLLPQKQSQQGPAFAVADVNNDGLEDVFLGGSSNQSAELYIQNIEGVFNIQTQTAFGVDKIYEDNGAYFFDADGDGDQDLYVASGGYELKENDILLQDRLYINDGVGNFKKSNKLSKITSSTKAVVSLDFDNDGDLDLAVGGCAIPGKYPLTSKSYILENVNGLFLDVTKKVAPEFSEIGLVNDMILTDYDGDNDKDLIIVGEWMPITVFDNIESKFQKRNIAAFEDTKGWWNTISAVDFDNDGDMDYFAGNLGSNNKFHPSKEEPLHIYGNDFDEDGNFDMVLSKLYNGNLVPMRGKECSTSQNPFVSQKIKTYKEFANATLIDIYGDEMLKKSFHEEANEFKSIYIENKGHGQFEIQHLPNMAQVGPTMSFVFSDINQDGHIDVLGIGAIHEAEVETVRYDANVGYILLGDSKGGLKSYNDISFYNSLNAKQMKLITVKNEPYLFIANNDDPLVIFKIKQN
jgi:hypothetical protein